MKMSSSLKALKMSQMLSPLMSAKRISTLLPKLPNWMGGKKENRENIMLIFHIKHIRWIPHHFFIIRAKHYKSTECICKVKHRSAQQKLYQFWRSSTQCPSQSLEIKTRKIMHYMLWNVTYSYNVYATESAADIAVINQIAISSILDYPTSKKHSIHHPHKDMQCDHTFSCLKKLKYLSMADDCTISAVPKSIRTVTE